MEIEGYLIEDSNRISSNDDFRSPLNVLRDISKEYIPSISRALGKSGSELDDLLQTFVTIFSENEYEHVTFDDDTYTVHIGDYYTINIDNINTIMYILKQTFGKNPYAYTPDILLEYDIGRELLLSDFKKDNIKNVFKTKDKLNEYEIGDIIVDFDDKYDVIDLYMVYENEDDTKIMMYIYTFDPKKDIFEQVTPHDIINELAKVTFPKIVNIKFDSGNIVTQQSSEFLDQTFLEVYKLILDTKLTQQIIDTVNKISSTNNENSIYSQRIVELLKENPILSSNLKNSRIPIYILPKLLTNDLQHLLTDNVLENLLILSDQIKNNDIKKTEKIPNLFSSVSVNSIIKYGDKSQFKNILEIQTDINNPISVYNNSKEYFMNLYDHSDIFILNDEQLDLNQVIIAYLFVYKGVTIESYLKNVLSEIISSYL